MWKCVSSTNMKWIVRFFREAVALDPYNAEALAGLSQALLVKCLWGGLHFSVAYPLAEAALQRALEINPESVEVKCVAAYFDLVAKRNWQAACRGFDEVLKHRSPTTRDLVGQALLRIAEGSQLEASGLLQEAMKLNALSSLTVALYCWNEYLAGECANAIDQVAQARASGQFGLVFDAVEALVSIQIEAPAVHIHRIEALVVESPLHDVLKGALGYAYGMAGQGQKAREILDALMCSGAQQKKCDPYAITLVLLGLNQRQEAVKWAEKSYREGSLWSFGFQSDLILASLRHDPHYRQFMSSVSYPAAENASLRLGSVG
jgi:tetratricopeptide (TPR) repeat protein